MIYRFLYRGYFKDKKFAIKDNCNACSISVFTYNEFAFLYFESKCENVDPTTVISGNMKEYPSGLFWEEMSEVFHYSVPIDDEWGVRKEKNKIQSLRINFLRQQKISSYYYYHFQYQEEFPCDGDKYGMVFNLGNMLILYGEEPNELAPKNYDGLLSTTNSPRHEKWAELMNEHFSPDFGGWAYLEKNI